MKVSIIIPVYNGEKYIKRAVESVVNQNYRDLEIIIINDGSTDNTLDVIKNIKDERIKVINKENSGVSNSRNVGIEKANGDYLMFLDSDDYIEKEYIQEIDKKVDLVITNYKEDYKNKVCSIDCFKSMKFGINEITNINIEETICSNGGYVWGKFFKKSIVDKYSLRFNEQYNMCEDLLFILSFIIKSKIALKRDCFGYIYFRGNENSITSKVNLNDIINQISIQEEINKIIKFKLGKEERDKLLSRRFKSIFMFIIYKIVMNNKVSRKEKINQIEELFKYNYIEKVVNDFKGEGPIDKRLVKSIKNRNVKKIYLYTKIREAIIKIR